MSGLTRLLRPKSIALLGGVWAKNVYEQLRKSNFSGEIWPVHPTSRKLGIHKCFKDISSLPGSPDATFIGVNRYKTIEIIKDLDSINAGGAVCFASGFSELSANQPDSEGNKLQNELVMSSKDLPILGPNCYGFLNYLDNITLWPDQHGGCIVEKGVAIISQSSNIAINLTMQKRNLPIAYVLTVGNQAKTGISELIEAMLDDPRVTAIGLYIEGFGNLESFEAAAARATILRKPIIALKTGRTEASIAATLSHTASITGKSSVASAFLTRLGCIEVMSLTNLLETLKMIHFAGYLSNSNIASVSCAGGEASLLADRASETLIQYKPFDDRTKEKLTTILGPIVNVSNPFDYHTFIWGDTTKMIEVFSIVLNNPFALVVFILDVPRDDRCDVSSFQCAIEAIIAAKHNTKVSVAVVSSIPESMPESLAERFIAAGVIPLCGIDEALSAINNSILLGSFYLNQSKNKVDKVLLSKSVPKINSILMDEKTSKDLLKPYGLQVPKSIAANSENLAFELVDFNKLKYPLVTKGLGIAHKTEAGLVIININNKKELKNALKKILALSQKVLVEEMITDTITELSVAVVRDKTGLFLLTIGSGGIFTELFTERVNMLLPVTNDYISEAIDTLNISSLINGYRNGARANKKSIVEAIQAVASYTNKNSSFVSEIEINPLIVGKKSSIAVDILLTHIPKENKL